MLDCAPEACVARKSTMGANELTALTREAIVIQPPSCKPFGPTLNVVSSAMYVGNP